MKKILLFNMAFIITLFFSCNEMPDNADNSISHKKSESKEDNNIIQNLVTQWNDEINRKDTASLSFLYATQVEYYGNITTKEVVLKDKFEYFQEHKDYRQQVNGTIQIQKLNNMHYKAIFYKQYHYDKTKESVKAFLVFQKENNQWKIIKESDEKTAAYLNNKTAYQSCIETVIGIIEGSNSYNQITNGLAERVIKNGGNGYGILIDASPNPLRDNALNQSDNYELSLHENYEDRNPVIARYVFNPKEKLLYEYNVAEDILVSIPFDKSLLTQLNICK